MLTVDQAGISRRGERLILKPLQRSMREWALELAEGYVGIVRQGIGRPRHEIEEALSSFEVLPRERKLADGLCKLLLDACEFEMETDADPVQLRRKVFLEASALRKLHGKIDRASVLAKAGRETGLAAEQVEELLFADLRDAHRMVSAAPISPAGLVDQYERGRAQAVLLRATSVELRIEEAQPAVLRALFGRLKFWRLLHRIHKVEQGYRVIVDGPLSLFGSVTKYGLSMAMLLPLLGECGRWRLRAQVLWGKQRQPCVFELEGKEEVARTAPPPMPEDLRRFAARFTEQIEGYELRPCCEILEVPGEGLCVPDLLFVQQGTGQKVYFEVMGYWSREAVFRKVDLVEKGLPHKAIFAVSERLRVSQEVLPAQLPAALYVYKGVMSPGRVRDLLDRLCQSPGSAKAQEGATC